MNLPYLPRPLLAALCGFTLATAAAAQERAREERPSEGQRPPRGDFRPDDRRREDARPGEGVRREEFRRDEGPRGEGRPMDRDRGDFRPSGPGSPPFNPQELFRDLNEDQRASLRGFFEAQQKVMREFGERSMQLRREIAEQAMAEKLNEGLIREKTMEAAKLEAEATIARARAFAQVRERLPRETVERLRQMVANPGPRPGFAPPGFRRDEDPRPEGEFRRPPGQREGDQFRRPAGEEGRRPAEGDFRRPAGPRDGDQIRKPSEGDRGPRPNGDRGSRPEGERGRTPEGGERRPESPRRPPAEQ